MVTSRADTGSSAIRSFGSCISAVPIQILCRLQSLARKYNISSIETILHWAQDYCKDGELAFEEKRGRATKENSPFKGRPRIRFVSENEKEEYLKQKEEYYKKD